MMKNLLTFASVAKKTTQLLSTVARLRLLLVMFLTLTVSANTWGATWEKATSIAAGDVVLLVCESKTMELNGISTTSTKYGIGVAYTTSPAGAYELTVEAGSSSGTYSLKNGSNYLYWNSGNSLATNTTKSANTSWSITFSNGDATIKNAKDNSRIIGWNASSPRFACYTSSQTAVQLYKKVSTDPCASLAAPIVTTTNITNNSFTLSWNAVAGADSYNVYNYTADVAENITTTSYTFTELTPNTEYEWEIETVKSTCSKGTTGTTTTRTLATITLSEAGVETPVTGKYVGDPYTLPSTTSQSCGDLEFVGWSTVEINNSASKPASNYYAKGASVTLAANQTFYAVFATESETTSGTTTTPTTASLSFASTAQRTTLTTSQQVWTQNGITLTNDKGSSTSNVADYSNPARFYKSSKITITAPGNITKIVFKCVKDYVISITGATTSGYNVTVSLDGTSDTYTVNTLSAQVRMNSLEVTYDKTTTGGTTITYSDYTTSCSTETLVSLNPNGGSGETESVTATYGQPMPTITPPTRAGYDFQGYFTANDGTGTQYYNADGTSAKDWDKEDATFTLYAHWKAKTYTVTLNNQGATTAGATSVTATYNAAMPSIASNLPQKTGYTFNGYFDATSGGTKYYKTDGTSAKNWDKIAATTLYAQWECQLSKVAITGPFALTQGQTFELSAEAQDVNGNTITCPNEAIYTWQYWDGSNWQNMTDNESTDKTKLIYASCNVEDHCGKFRCVVNYGDCIAYSNTDTKDDGYKVHVYHIKGFGEWNTPYPFIYDANTRKAVLTMKLEANTTYEFSIYGSSTQFFNGGEITSNATDWVYGLINYGNTKITTTIAGDYIFTLDYSDGANNNLKLSVTYPQKKMVYFNPNMWDADDATEVYTVYSWQEGSNGSFVTMTSVEGCGNTNIYQAEIDASHNKLLFIRWNQAHTAWDDNRWNQSIDLDYQTNGQYKIDDWGNNSDLYWKNGAKKSWASYEKTFTPNHTVSFNANGHGTAPDAQCVAKNVKATTPAAPTETGYTFGGWYTDQACNNAWDFENDVVTKDIILYAKWTINTHTVTWKPAGGNWSGNTNDIVQTYKYDELIEAPEEPVRTGYEFVEWKPTYTADMTMPDNDLEFTAQWKINQYTVTLNPNYPNGKTGTFTYEEGELVDGNLVFTYDYNTASMTIEDLYTSLTLGGYEFGGWYNAKGVNPGEVSGSKCTTTGTITGNKTYFAKWTKLYSITLSENGTTTTPTTQTSTSYTLPTELSVGTCENDEKELVGWSTVAIPTPGDKPTTNFYELGETVTLTEEQTTFYAVFATGTTTDEIITTEETATLSFENVAQRTSFSTTQQVWEQNGIVFTNNKADSSTDIADYTNPVRCYKNSEIIIDCNALGNITKVQFKCSTSDFAGDLENSIGLEATSSGTWVTLIPKSESKTYEITLTAGQTRISTLTVTYEKIGDNASSVSYSDYSTVCEAIPDPVWGGAEIDNATISVNCGETSPMNSAATISFPADKNNTLTYDITVTASNGFLLSTNKTNDAGYGESVTVSPVKTGTNAGTITQKVYVRAVAPAQSDEEFNGTITISGKQITTQTINVTADVTCAQYTLTLVDRGVSTEQPTKYYSGETIDEAPADPEGVCTDPIHYVFDGWAAATVAEGSTTYTKVTFPYTVTGNTKFYAVYRYVEEGSGDSGDYVKVTDDLDDYSGDYLFVYETGNVAFDGGRNNVDDELDATSNTIEVTIDNNTIASNATTDAAKFTIAKVDGGYSIQSASGYYIGWGGEKNGLNTNSSYTVAYLNTISNNTICGKTGYLKFNKASGQERFRYYQSGQEDIALYRKAASYLYTTSPVCGPHLVITEGKEIYVTGGNAQAARDLVMAQQKVSYKATRLNTKDGSAGGTAPDVKVATNGITKGGVVTTEVKVTFENTVKELQPDDTYTIIGDIVVTYEADANNMQEDIQVQLAVDYPANADARDNFIVHARSLPSEFVIVAKSGEKWYALNADMSGDDAELANGQVTLNDLNNPTEATYAPCNAIYTFEAMPQGAEDRISVRFIGQENKYLWAASGTNTGIQNNSTNPAADALAYNWKLYTEDNITYRFGNANSNRQLTLNGEKFGMYASGVQDIRILPYVEKCLYNYAPSNLKVSVLKGTYVTLTWDAVIGATKYQYSTNGTTWTDAGTEPTVTINGLTGATKYTYYIRAYHEDAGVSQECIDYAEITFTTANCDDVPTDITYSADMNSIIVSWIANAATSTVNLYSDEEAEVLVATQSVASPCTFTDLAKNTQYYVQILANGTCASPIIPVKTEDVEVDIVEWSPDSIIVDINTNEDVEVILENEVAFGSGLGSLAEDLFFSKYFEGSGSLKMIAIYNGTGKDVDLSEYRIDRGSNGNATNISKTYDLSQLGIIKQGQEIIFYSWPLISEYSYSCSQSFLDSKVQESGLDANPRWIWCDAKTHNGIEFEAMDFSGNDPLLLYKSSELIDVFGVSTEQESPASTQICSGRSDQAWSADGVTNMDYGKTIEDFPNGEIPYGVNVDDETITAYTARVIMFRKNTVVSGKNAVTKNTTTFATFAEEWEARQVCMSGDDGDLTCAAYQELGTFDYSDYYTKYVPMEGGIVKNDENQNNNRNADGTLTISIRDLYKHACSNIRIKYTNSDKTEVLADREYKVPIMITTDQATAYTEANKDDNAFYALQENLATVEVDGNGNPTGNKTNLTLEQVREICKTCDVVIRDNAILTKAADDDANDHPQVNNVFIYEGASLVIPDGTNETITSLSLRRKGDIVASAKVEKGGNLHLPASATAPIYLDMRIDANNWHWFTLPYNCNIADVTWVDGTPAQYNKDWFIMYYDGNSRAHEESIYENHWKVYNGTTIEAGKGYIVGIQGDITHPDYTSELRFPMTTEVLTNEHTPKTVAVNAWGVKMDITPNKKGWNLVGNPYLDYYKTSENISFKGLSLIEYLGIDPVTGERLYQEGGTVPFLVTPVDGGWYEYQQELASDVEMMPFTAYFVQVGDPENPDHTDDMELHAQFESDHRGRMSLIRRAPQEVDGEQEPVIVRVEVANTKGESDKTTLIIDDRFTNEYEMNGDFFKWFGDYYRRYTKPVLYSMGADHGKRAFNALSEQLAAQPVALGMFAAQAGDYTFSLTRKRCDLSRVEEVWLYDATTATYTNLMQQDYTFTTAKTEGEGRFYLSVKMKQKTPTAVENVNGNLSLVAHQQTLVLSGLPAEAQVWVYDATGKLLHSEHTTAYQRIYPVQQAGVYFVSVKGQGDAQTLSTIVK